MEKQKDASMGCSGETGRSLDKGSAGRSRDKLTVEQGSSNIEKDRYDNSFQIKKDSEN